jgi:hypothetical protein
MYLDRNTDPDAKLIQRKFKAPSRPYNNFARFFCSYLLALSLSFSDALGPKKRPKKAYVRSHTAPQRWIAGCDRFTSACLRDYRVVWGSVGLWLVGRADRRLSERM